MAIKVIPVGDRLLIKRGLQPEKTKGGIFIPEAARMNTEIAKVIFVSEEVSNTFKEGDTIVVGRYTGVDINIEDNPFTLVRVDDVIGKVVEVMEKEKVAV